MSAVYKLPKNKDDLSVAIRQIIAAGRRLRNVEQVKWLISYYYLQGVREFDVIDYTRGDIQIAYRNENGTLNFRYDEINAQYTSRLGRLMSMDLSPSVEQRGMSLEGTRKRSVAQVVLNELFPQDKIELMMTELCPHLTTFGTIGLGLWVDSLKSYGVEIIPPWELLPIPANISGPQDVKGLVRIRWVPKDWVKGLELTPSAGSKKYKTSTDVHIPFGMGISSRWEDGRNEGVLMGEGGGFSAKVNKSKMHTSGGSKKKDETIQEMTQLVEVWIETNDRYLGEYAILSGTDDLELLHHQDHSGEKYHMPIRIIRDSTVPGFWGRSFVDQLIPLNNEIEHAISNLFEYLDDFDIYGMLLWPTSLGTPEEAHRGSDGIKKLVYEQDYTVPDAKPEMMTPTRLTAPQVQALNVGLGMMDRIANQPRAMMQGEAPGRVDGAPGLGHLSEMANIPLGPTVKSIAQGVSGIYRAALRISKDTWNDERVVELSLLDDTLAGIVLDAKSGTLSLSKNAIPDPNEVTIKISSEMPVSKEQSKQELKEALSTNRITLEEYSFEVRRRGLDLPVGLEVEWHNYQRAMLENIILFGDGQIPGEITTTERDLHRVHKKVLESFMARPAFFLASVEVRDAFEEHWQEHRNGEGGYPEQLPPMEDAAAMEIQNQLGGAQPPTIQ